MQLTFVHWLHRQVMEAGTYYMCRAEPYSSLLEAVHLWRAALYANDPNWELNHGTI